MYVQDLILVVWFANLLACHLVDREETFDENTMSETAYEA